MSNFTIPNSRGEIRQVNSGDLFGELNETFNIDLTTSQGKIKVSDKLVAILTEGGVLGTPTSVVDMLIWNSNYYILTDDEAYKCFVANDPTNPNNWTEETKIPDLDNETTAVIFDGQMRISTGTDIMAFDGSTTDNDWWTAVAGGTALNNNVPHVLEVVQSGKETLFVTDGPRVQYLEKGSTTKTVQLDSNVEASCLAPGLSGAMWVGTFNETSGQAQVYEMYVGAINEEFGTPAYRQAYPVRAHAVLAIWMQNNVPHIVTEKGEVQAFNGAGFSTVAEFPFKYTSKFLNGARTGNISSNNANRPVHPRGVKVHNDSVYINIKSNLALAGAEGYPADVRSHSGIWEYNMKTEVLNHRFSMDGQLLQTNTGPILVSDNDYTFIMVGGQDETTDKVVVYMNDDSVSNQGWFITPEISSGTVESAYESVYHKAKTLAVDEEIVTQYRTRKRDTIKAVVNWIDATTCTSTDDFTEAVEGDLIRIIWGTSPGEYANIVSIEKSASTYTIVVDKEIGETGTISNVYCDNFKRDAGTYLREDGEVKRLGGYGTNPWIQFAVFLKGAIEYRQFISKDNSKAEK